MSDYRKTLDKSSNSFDFQTGAIPSLPSHVKADLVGMDSKVPVDTKQGLSIQMNLQHDFEYIGQDDPNRCNPETADLVNPMGFIAGTTGGVIGASALTAGTGALATLPVPGARVLAAGVLATGAIGSVLSGGLEKFTGGFQYSIMVMGRKKGTDRWYQLGQALPCLAAAGMFDNSSRTVEFGVHSPHEPGEWEIKAVAASKAGQKIDEFTQTIHVAEGAKGGGGGAGGNTDFTQWAIDNPILAGVGGLAAITAVRSTVESAVTGEA